MSMEFWDPGAVTGPPLRFTPTGGVEEIPEPDKVTPGSPVETGAHRERDLIAQEILSGSLKGVFASVRLRTLKEAITVIGDDYENEGSEYDEGYVTAMEIMRARLTQLMAEESE